LARRLSIHKTGLEEALAEAGLAIKFLEQGLHRNVAGKAFQAWKALLAAAAARHREVLSQRYLKDKTGKTGQMS
jgi:Archaeal PaREP1/PaREP8 family.